MSWTTAPTGRGTGAVTVKSNTCSWLISPVAARMRTWAAGRVAAVAARKLIPEAYSSIVAPSARWLRASKVEMALVLAGFRKRLPVV